MTEATISGLYISNIHIEFRFELAFRNYKGGFTCVFSQPENDIVK